MADGSNRESKPTLAYLMTDVVGSTRLWEERPEEMIQCIALLDRCVEDEVGMAGGRLVKSRGEGDSHFSVFGSSDAAIRAATGILIAVGGEPTLKDIKLRAAIHAGAAEDWAGDYYGPVVNRCARIRQVARPGQILVSEVVQLLTQRDPVISFKSLGVHRLRDLMQPERLFQVLHPDLPARFPSPDTLSSLPHNLPIHLTSFVGRNEDLHRLFDLIGSSRLTTLMGAGGVGKTRLALQVAAESANEFKDGIWFIDLAQTQREESVLPIVSGVIAPEIEPSTQNLASAIGFQKALLILDNCEHLCEQCRDLAKVLLLGCQNLTILATSRVLLEVPGEHVDRLGGLSLPPPHRVQDALQFDAIQLFVERAAQRGTGLVVNESTLPEIVDLCRKLDGLPLALEIASGLTDVQSIAEITGSIGECLEAETAHGAEDERQRTVAATIEWSRNLLSPAARDLLHRVAVFPGTWTLEAARDVCGFGAVSRGKLTELVRELVNHSLVFSIRTPRDAIRFGLLQTTREVLGGISAEDSVLLHRFLSHSHRIVGQAQSFLDEGEESKAHELIDLEWETLIKALVLSEEESPKECASIALGLKSFWVRGTRIREGKYWLEKLSTSEGIDSSLRVSVLSALSAICIWLGEYDQIERELLAAAETLGPGGGFELARVLCNLAVIREKTGRLVEAKEGFEHSLRLLERIDAPAVEAQVLLNLGVVKLDLAEPLSECARLFVRALERARSAGSASAQANAYSCMAHVEMREGRFREALRNCRLALKLWQDGPYLADCALAMVDVVEILLRLGRFQESASAFHIAERLEELSQSPFLSVDRARLESSRGELKNLVTPNDWRAAQRLSRSKSAPELITMALLLVDEAESPAGV